VPPRAGVLRSESVAASCGGDEPIERSGLDRAGRVLASGGRWTLCSYGQVRGRVEGEPRPLGVMLGGRWRSRAEPALLGRSNVAPFLASLEEEGDAQVMVRIRLVSSIWPIIVGVGLLLCSCASICGGARLRITGMKFVRVSGYSADLVATIEECAVLQECVGRTATGAEVYVLVGGAGAVGDKFVMTFVKSPHGDLVLTRAINRNGPHRSVWEGKNCVARLVSGGMVSVVEIDRCSVELPEWPWP
jgi:hypothetical protein